MTTTVKRRRYPTGDSIAESDDENSQSSNINSQLTSQSRMSFTNEYSSHRLIVSERQQLAVLKQLTASDELSTSPSSSTSMITQQRSTNVFRRNEHGETIVHIAARKGDLKRLEKALKDGANVNEEDNAGWTPLHEAVTKNQYRAVNLLLKSGANPNASGPEGQTPLMDAVLNNNIKIVVLLLNYSADPSVIDLTRLNETMIKALKGELTIFDFSHDENDEEPQSPLSLVNSADELEGEEKNYSESSSTFNSQASSKTSCKDTQEYYSTIDNNLSKNNQYNFEYETMNELESTSHFNDSIDKQSIFDIKENNRVPPLRIVLARTMTSQLSSTYMDENNTIESSLLPIVEQNEMFASTVTEKIVTSEEEEEEEQEKITDKLKEENHSFIIDKNNFSLSNFSSNQSSSSELIISTLMDNLLTQIEPNENHFEEQETSKNKKINDLKPTTRTLRSHARKTMISTLDQINSNENRRSSNRRRILEKKYSFDIIEKPRRKKTISERSNINETSSNSDDQPIENHSTKIITLKSSIIERISSHEDTNLSSIVDEDNNSINTNKTISIQSDINSLPPIKRRLRERNVALFNINEPIEENSSIEMNGTRDIPLNGIKQFLQIRQQIEKRHETMLHEFIRPKIPKDFSETLMAKKNYLLSPTSISFSSITPASLGIQRLSPPSDLDLHLSDVFTRQEDERYRMKLRHQVERDKLILSYEQEILRLYGNASRLSINQEIPFSYCLLLKDNEVYNNPINEERSSLINDEYSNTEGNKRARTRWNGRSFLKWLDESNIKYKRLSCEINQRQNLEANTLYSMQRMVWLKHIPKDTSTSNRMNSLLSERYLPKVLINTNFWTHWETNTI